MNTTELLDKNTFGGTKAAEILVAQINEIGDKDIARKVSKLFVQYSQGIHEIRRSIKNEKFRNSFMSLWIKHAHDKLEASDLPDKIKSYVANIETTLARRIRRGDFNNEHHRTNIS